MTHVEVTWPAGSASFARCTVDQLAIGTLTISNVDDGHVVREFRPGTWTVATVYGDDGYPQFAFEADGTRRTWRS